MMKRKVLVFIGVCITIAALCLGLSGCACEHQWVEATCETPKTCSLCNEVEGEALGHIWAEATCETPKTCSVCGKTEGDALGHTWVEATCEVPKTCSVCSKTEGDVVHIWVEATCETPKTCSRCSKIEGEALGHSWADATTEAPKTCTVCKKTQGQRIITDSRFKTASCKAFFGTWKGMINVPGSDFIEGDFDGTLELEYVIVFKPDGTYTEQLKMLNGDSFNKQLEDYYADLLYGEFEATGMNREQADAAMKETYGMDTKAYAQTLAAVVNLEAIFAAINPSGVYYVAGETLYSAYSWNAEMTTDSYTVSDTSLTIETLSEEFPGLVFTRIAD